MPKRTDISKILMIGSGPIVIGQACEFDYSGTQAIKALKEEGYEIILVNSNPATIMTDPGLADRIYLEPLRMDYIERIIVTEKPDALLPTLGGQTALNLAMQLHEAGILQRHKVEMLGAKPDVIRRAENREEFKETLDKIGIASARSIVVHSLEEGKAALKEIGLPVILRPSFTLGGEGGGVANSEEEYLAKLERALFLSPTHECLIEESLLGWKEFELEVIRDRKDNVIIVCSIENFDPMGVHTGDSITVAPAQTLTDVEYQNLRDQSIRIIRAIGVETGGSNIQFAVNPKNGRTVCIEMNPRVSRSSALASKATGFPIARVAAKLAVGYTLNELTNDITGTTPCSFEPSIDYVVTKIPRFDFEKFRPTPHFLTTQMKSVGEVMAIGRTFEESLGKAVAGLETSATWLAPLNHEPPIEVPTPYRLRAVADQLRKGVTSEEIAARTGIDRWFLDRIVLHLECEKAIKNQPWPVSSETLRTAKERGWTDRAIAAIAQVSEDKVREARSAAGIHGQFHMVDTCAAEFEAKTPYLYSSYRGTDESRISGRKKVMVIGGGPNRIGQGIEFDYCCVHAAQSLRSQGIECIMINSNPETVSTDFDISDKLYFEPLTVEHILNIARLEKPDGIIVQFGGQTPLKLAKPLERAGLKILGTSTQAIDQAEDREKCEELLRSLEPLGLAIPQATLVHTREEAIEKANALGYPVLVRPSYVLGGRGMKVVHSETSLRQYIDEAIDVSEDHPVLIDRFLDRAIEVDVDALSDGDQVLIGAILEHIEEAGIHSGDSACSMPPFTLSISTCDRIRSFTREIAKKLNVLGLVNIQYAIQGDAIYVLEVNPRASRTIPFISKATGFPLAKIAVEVMMGKKLKQLGYTKDFDQNLRTFHVKEAVFPFSRFPDVDVILGPEMKSTGEVMGRGTSFASAYFKALEAAGNAPPIRGNVFMSIRDEDKKEILPIAQDLQGLGFQIYATSGTADFLRKNNISVERINKVHEGAPHCVGAIEAGKFALVINTTSDEVAIKDSFSIRRATLERKIPYCTVVAAARAMIQAISIRKRGPLEILPL